MDLSALGPSAAVVVVVITFIKYMSLRDQKQDETNKELAAALKKLSSNTAKNTEATISADTYLKQRNGRDIEKHEELLKATQAIPETMQAIADLQAEKLLDAVKIHNQYVEHQHVDKETVKEKVSPE